VTTPEPGTVDFIYLLDRLEEALAAGSRVPLTARTLVDEQECLDIVDQMRVTLPNEIKFARRLVAEREHLLAQAREEAERIIRNAELRAGRLVEDHEIVRGAKGRAVEIEDEAERTARELRDEAERYAGQILGRIAERLRQALDGVTTGLHELETRDPPVRSHPDAVPVPESPRRARRSAEDRRL
jgi:vacuolar-type H+-ATPase subunit H